MDDEELHREITSILDDSIAFIDQEVSPERAKAAAYYNGEKFGNEEDGRSQVILTEVRDGVIGVLPSLLRIIFGPERVCEYAPHGPEDVGDAEQATDYVNHIFENEQSGFLKTHAVLKDGLIKKLGIYKWWWDDTSGEKSYRLENISQSQLELLASDPEVELTRIEQRTVGRLAIEGEQPGEATFDVELTRHESDGHLCIEAIPPEELLISREARSRERGLCFAHRTRKTRGELIRMNIPADVIDEYGQRDATLNANEEEIERRGLVAVGGATEDPDAGEANDKILYIEAYPEIDFDGDGIAELRKVCTIGPGYHVVHNEPVDERPFAVWCPDPEPHTVIGSSWADRLMDMQLLGSTLLRASLDSLAASIFPRTVYVEGQVAVEDVLNTAIGAPIRANAPGMVQPIITPFVGKEALPFLELVHDTVERRTGQNKGAMGLDADALQSSTKAAVGAAVTAAQMQTELLVRLFVEQALKPLFRGCLKTLVKHQPRSRMVRLRNQWVEVDPRVWDADMDVQVNVALGTGFTEEKIATLMSIAEKQEQVFTTMGLSNPLVTVGQYRNTLAQILELHGFKDSSRYFKPVPDNWEPPAPQPQMSPEQMLAQAQTQIAMMKTQRELAIKEAELQLKREEMALNAAREDRKLAMEATLKRYAIDAQFKAGFTEAQLEQDAEMSAQFLEHGREIMAQQHAQALAAQQQAHDQALARAQQAHEQQLAEQQQEHEQQLAAQQAASESSE